MFDGKNDKRLADDILEFKQQYSEFITVQTELPPQLAEKYQVLSFLFESKRSEIFLAADKQKGNKCILKIFNTGSFENEDPIIKHLNHPYIPKFIEIHRAENKTYLVREYFEGQNLAEYLNGKGPLPVDEMLKYTLQICDVLNYLHTREKPIIYRDIKAENIIITEEDQIRLIDFDISREYDESANHDTVYYGTKEYSAPEQFGYAQTDARTDIYSLGILMLFMLTGSMDRANLAKIENAPLKHIIAKCLSFSPEDRFPSAKTLKKALNKANRPQKMIKTSSAAVLSVLVFILGIFIGIGIDKQGVFSAFTSDKAGVAEFHSELIEQAVRTSLGKENNEPVYVSELDDIENLYIYGKNVYSGEQTLLLKFLPGFTDVEVCFAGYDGPCESIADGTIQSLEDLRMFTGLKHLELVMQDITDLSPLAGLPIEHLNLAGNNIEDISTLSALPQLVDLNMDGNPLSDIGVLASLEHLQVLNASDTLISDLSPLTQLYDLKYLYINDARIYDVSPLSNLELINCFLKNNPIEDLSPLENVENLQADRNP